MQLHSLSEFCCFCEQMEYNQAVVESKLRGQNLATPTQVTLLARVLQSFLDLLLFLSW